MRILVTGGAGFIGANLCERLLNEGHNVLCVDDYISGCRENIEHLVKNPNFDICIWDISDYLGFNCEQIYNLACPASPVFYQKNSLSTIRVCTEGMVRMLDQASKNSARILQASTSEVYGDPTEHPQKESYRGNVNTLGPRACYDEGKRIAETLCMEYHRQYKTDIRIARIFNTYGPGMRLDDGRVVSNFIMQALRNEPITIYGDGNQTRSFCYVDDMIDGLIKLMNQDKIIGPVNLGNSEQYVTMSALALYIREITHSKSQRCYQSLPVDDPCMRKPDISMAEEFLDWSPTVDLQEGLTRTIEYFRKFV